MRWRSSEFCTPQLQCTLHRPAPSKKDIEHHPSGCSNLPPTIDASCLMLKVSPIEPDGHHTLHWTTSTGASVSECGSTWTSPRPSLGGRDFHTHCTALRGCSTFFCRSMWSKIILVNVAAHTQLEVRRVLIRCIRASFCLVIFKSKVYWITIFVNLRLSLVSN